MFYLKIQTIMKKVLIAVVACMAMGFASCGNKTQATAEATDSIVVDEQNVDEAVTAITSALTEQIEAKDANKFQEVLATVQEQVKEFLTTNPQLAAEYVTKVQEFLKANTEQIKAFAGDNAAVTAAVAAITTTPAETFVNTLSSAVGGVEEAGQAAVDQTVDAANAAVESAKKAGQDAVDNTKKAAEDAANAAKEDAKKKANDAIDQGADKLKKGLGL